MDAKDYLEIIESELKQQIQSYKFVQPLRDAINYVMFPGGKRIRPLFSAFLAQDFGGDIKNTLKVAATIEYIHAASLIHDDLPAMDNDDMRRGRPSCHRAFSEATAILAADTLMVLPFEVLADFRKSSELAEIFTADNIVKMSGYLAEAFRLLCNGQQLDLLGSKDLAEVYRGKTGALFAVAAKIATLVAGKSDAVVNKAGLLGEALGIYFQIVDDFIDAKGIKGRGETSSDEKNHKKTFMVQDEKPENCEKLILAKENINKHLNELKTEAHDSDFTGVRYIINMVEKSLEAK